MRELRIGTEGGAILADAELGIDWDLAHFDPAAWQARGRCLASADAGRGPVVFVRHQGDEWALRRYRRGGMARRLSRDRYLWLGEDRTRSFREWRLLGRLDALGLPVPRPVAAHYERSGATYAASLITRRIAGARPLSTRLSSGSLPEGAWRRIGACVRRFHEAGACHADLNAYNILLDDEDRPWLLDFDRGSLRAPGAWRRRNLDRLLRSLRKISAADATIRFAPADWDSLLTGYAQTSA